MFPFWVRWAPLAVYAGAHLVVVAWIRGRVARTWSPRRTVAGIAFSFAAVAALSLARQVAVHDGTDREMWTWGALQLWSLFVTVVAFVLASIEVVLFVVRLVHARVASTTTKRDDAAENDAPRDEDRRRAVAKIGGLAVGVASAAPILWGTIKTRLDVEVIELPIKLRLPHALDGLTFVQLSDVHVGAYVGERELAHVEEIVRGMKPDLIVFTGDLVNLQRRWLAPACRWLARLAEGARFGAKAIVGNHEHYAGVYACMDAMRAAGVDVLFNEGRIVAPNDGGGIGIVGVDDLYGPMLSQSPGPRVATALSKLPPDRARVLLCHQPTFVDRAARYGFDLMLSGHTHGGQVAPVGTIVAKRMFGTAAGLAKVGDTTLYVNRGFGTSGPPTRVGVRPEITKIVLASA
jgi:predicted MPP superfamily phosphohydrolase